MDRYITKESIEGLIQKLELPAGDEYSQDWEYEIASSELAIKTLTAYINRDDLSEDERFTLMHVVLGSVNDFVIENAGEFPLFDEFKRVLKEDYLIHESTLEYWAAWELDDLEDAFEITPIIRSIIKDISVSKK